MNKACRQVDRALVHQVASLAHLELTEDEAAYYQVQLTKVLDHIELLTDMPDPLADDWCPEVLLEATPERADERVPSLSPELAVVSAACKQGSAFQVPRIIE